MKILAVILATAALALAQEKSAPPKPDPLAPGEVIRVVDIKQADANLIRNSLGSIFPGITRVGGQLIVRGQPAVVDMIEAAIKKLDVAPPPAPESRPVPNVEITVQLLYGSAQESTGGSIPADLEGTVRQLRALFPYKGYRVLDTQIARIRTDGRQRIEMSGTLPGGKSYFQFRVQPSIGSGPAPRLIRLGQLNLDISQPIPNGAGVDRASISTELDAREGQKTVVGKANLANTEDAVILVITPKVIE